ncbi:hypothetical protein [Streptomyces sp. RKAG293]|uniref:hypothetical protein n=1 Tax=Streptomyces sp. RKAG293 TaxID=2893403 RepID=UPI002033720A|nr:hypothetical protein [Streptomyces sp. RKAG293]MCM2424231.1 hypothetical protein [Streptomyces sp. RKAG293]
MPDLPEPSPDLIALQRAYDRAHAAASAYADAVAAERRALHPDPDTGWDPKQAALRNAWPAEQADQLTRLQAERLTALKALTGHPEVAAARYSGTMKSLRARLQDLAEDR